MKFSAASSQPPVCPKCKAVLPREEINVAADLAYCRLCNLAHKLSALFSISWPEFDPRNLPAGTWYQSSPAQTVMGASHRSLGAALGLLCAALFWNGIVSFFVMGAALSTLSHLGIELPAWFPKLDLASDIMPLPMTIFMWIFLIPFVVIGLGMLAAFFSSLAGRTEVVARSGQVTLFRGIGPIGLRKNFERAKVKEVLLAEERWKDSEVDSSGRTNIVIELMDAKPIKFGSALPEKRKRFLAGALRRTLLPMGSKTG